MKEVICINNKPINGFSNRNLHLIKEGEKYNVSKKVLTLSDRYNYIIDEVNFHFSEVRFIPVSDIDETELVNEKAEATA